MLAKWPEQIKKEENELLWHRSVFLNVDLGREKKCWSACHLVSQHCLHPNSFGQALWNRSRWRRLHRSCFDRCSLVNANGEHGSSTQALSRFDARPIFHIHIFQNRKKKPQLSTFKLSSSSSSHGIFMALHLFRIMYRESYPPRGKLVWRELSIMSFEGHFPYFSHRYLGPSTLTSASAGWARGRVFLYGSAGLP